MTRTCVMPVNAVPEQGKPPAETHAPHCDTGQCSRCLTSELAPANGQVEAVGDSSVQILTTVMKDTDKTQSFNF